MSPDTSHELLTCLVAAVFMLPEEGRRHLTATMRRQAVTLALPAPVCGHLLRIAAALVDEEGQVPA